MGTVLNHPARDTARARTEEVLRSNFYYAGNGIWTRTPPAPKPPPTPSPSTWRRLVRALTRGAPR